MRDNRSIWVVGVIVLVVLVGIGIGVSSGSLRGGDAPTVPSTLLITATLTATPRPTSTATPPPPPPTATPTATPTPTALPAPTSAPQPTALPDAAADLVDYNSLAAAETTLSGVDIREACWTEEGRLLRTLPEDMAALAPEWDPAENLLLWLRLNSAIPLTPTTTSYWLFALDVDADTATGRPVGDGRINPDLGSELTVGIYFDPEGDATFVPYLMVWNAATGEVARHSLQADVRFDGDRDAILMRLPLEALETALANSAQVTPDWERARGRAATLAYTEAGLLADFCTDLP